jgi:hypothetical protein
MFSISLGPTRHTALSCLHSLRGSLVVGAVAGRVEDDDEDTTLGGAAEEAAASSREEWMLRKSGGES